MNRKIKEELREIVSKLGQITNFNSEIVLWGSHYYEQATYGVSDYDILVIINNPFSFLKLIKKKLDLPYKYNVHFIWGPLIWFRIKSIAGQSLTKKRKIKLKLMKEVKKEIRTNRLKQALFLLIKAKKEKDKKALANSLIAAHRCAGIHLYTDDRIFSWKENLKITKNKLIKQALNARIKNKPLPLSNLKEAKAIINKIYKTQMKKSSFLIQFNLQYYFFMLKNKKFPRLFINFNKEIINASYALLNQEKKRAKRILQTLLKKKIEEKNLYQELDKITNFNILEKKR